MFTGKNPEVSHLKICGFPVYVHIPKEKRTKLGPSGKKGMFVDTVKSPNPSEYALQDPITRIFVEMPHLMKKQLSRSKKCLHEEVYE